jgi:hypothetical protein
MKTTLAAGTALLAAALASVAPATAAPFQIPGAAAVTTGATGIATVGHKHHCYGCGAAAVGLGAFALGLALASQPQPTVVRECTIERTKRWSPRLRAYVVRTEKVCY